MKKLALMASTMLLVANNAMSIQLENQTSVTKNLVFKAATPPLTAEIQLNQAEFSVGNSESYEVAKLILSTPGFSGIYKAFKWANTPNQSHDLGAAVVFEKNDPTKYIGLHFGNIDGYDIVPVVDSDGAVVLDEHWMSSGFLPGSGVTVTTYNTDMVQRIPIILNTATEAQHAGVYPITIDVATFKL
ncbi:hypothetical protein OR233_004437 [Enterobacter asburiae]|nr:hypothetical protein [Enterobacter asburiae]